MQKLILSAGIILLAVILSLAVAGSINLSRAAECEAKGGKYNGGLFSGACVVPGAAA